MSRHKKVFDDYDDYDDDYYDDDYYDKEDEYYNENELQTPSSVGLGIDFDAINKSEVKEFEDDALITEDPPIDYIQFVMESIGIVKMTTSGRVTDKGVSEQRVLQVSIYLFIISIYHSSY
jgi:hypothetical protein